MNPRAAIQQAVNEEILEIIGGTKKTFKANDVGELDGTYWVLNGKVLFDGCPPFSTSLDAMAIAEGTLTKKELATYGYALESFAKTTKVPLCVIPAELRARAFVLVKG